jgi:hypothetical protein
LNPKIPVSGTSLNQHLAGMGLGARTPIVELPIRFP